MVSEQTSCLDAPALMSGDLDDESDSQEADAMISRVSLRLSDSAVYRVRNNSDDMRRASVSSGEYERHLSRKSSIQSVNSEFSFEASSDQTYCSTMKRTDSSESITQMALPLSHNDSDQSPSVEDSGSVIFGNDSTGLESDDIMSISSQSTPCADLSDIRSRPGTPAQPAGPTILAPFHGVSLCSPGGSGNDSREASAEPVYRSVAGTTILPGAPLDGMDYSNAPDNNDEMFLREEMFLQEELENLRRGEVNAAAEPTSDALFERYIQELASSTASTDIFDSFNFDGIFSDSFPNSEYSL